MIHHKRILCEDIAQAMEPRFKALSDFIEHNGGEDLVRYLHAQEVEIVAHSSGALLKCYRTKEKDTANNPEDCWRFWSGRYEVDLNHLDDDNVGFSIGFTQKDLRKPIEQIIQRTKSGKLDAVDPGTLIVVEIGTRNPETRLHKDDAKARMVVVGVKYEVPETGLSDLLTDPGEIEEQALKMAGRWESHAQVQSIAHKLGTDSLPLLFRGRLEAPEKVVAGMAKSAEQDPAFSQILNNFLAQAGDQPTEKDYERFFRHAIRRFDDFDIRKLDKQGKVSDSTAVTRDAYRDVVAKLYRRAADVDKEIADTIEEYGANSREHLEDYRDLNYLSAWVRGQVGRYLFADANHDPITQAIHSLEEIKGDVTEDAVMQWVRRHLEEEGVPGDLYALHLNDENVPTDRHTGRGALWDAFLVEANKFIKTKLADLISDSQAAT
jgi:hypothetical protein